MSQVCHWTMVRQCSKLIQMMLKQDTFGSTTGRPEIGRKTLNFGIMKFFEEAESSVNIFPQDQSPSRVY